MVNRFAAMYDITPSRIACNLLSTTKRAILNGQSEILVGEPGTQSVPNTSNSNSGSFPIWIIVAAVVGGIVLLLAIVVIIVFLVKKGTKKQQWEKY